MTFDKEYYRTLTLEELYDVSQNIDAEKYPERYEIVLEVLEEISRLQVEDEQFDFDLDSGQIDSDSLNLDSVEVDSPEADSLEVDCSKQPIETDIKQFTTSDLTIKDTNILLLKKNVFLSLLGALVIFVPLGVVLYLQTSVEVSNFELFLSGLVGLAVVFSVFTQRREIKLDKNTGLLILKGTDMTGGKLAPRKFKISQIAAIQLLSFQLKDYPQAFFRNSDEVGNLTHIYQLNLVLKNNQRINISQTVDGFEVIALSRKLARFLMLPVWNNIDAHTKDIEFANKHFG